MDIAITDKEFNLFREIIYNETGINLKEHKKPLLVSRLTRRLMELGINSFSEYYRMVVTDKGELVRLLDRVSTNLTEFFREARHFDFLRGGFLDELKERAKSTGQKKIRIWSAACSTGEEPYSIAISLLEGLGRDSSWDIKILASDICTEALEAAECAVYTEERLQKVPRCLWSTYFLRGRYGCTGKYRVKGFVREMLVFRRFNLKERTWPIRGGFDAIFIRNVLIYFDRPTQDEIVGKLLRYLNNGGYLFLGHSETMLGKRDGLRMIVPSVYRRSSE